MSVTGFDNVRLSEFCYPALTTVHIPLEQIGLIVCESLISKSGQWAEAGDALRLAEAHIERVAVLDRRPFNRLTELPPGAVNAK